MDEESIICLLAGKREACSQLVVDSIATYHMCFEMELFVDLEEVALYNINIGDSSVAAPSFQ